MPRRHIEQGDGLEFLARGRLPADHAIITSLPDSSEIPKLGYQGWRTWFSDTVAKCIDVVADTQVAVFFQTDVKRDGLWVDKGFLCQLGAEKAGAGLLFHKVVCRAPPGTTTFGRPAWAHLLAFSRSARLEPGRSTPDVLPRLGKMPWARAMGVEACIAACKFTQMMGAQVVVDPFCGLGTVLAVANALGQDGLGVELSPKRAERARALEVTLE